VRGGEERGRVSDRYVHKFHGQPLTSTIVKSGEKRRRNDAKGMDLSLKLVDLSLCKNLFLSHLTKMGMIASTNVQ
jgi:hypothetical protein